MKRETHLETATFAGGCFWCMASAFDHLDGVRQVLSGYTGGHLDYPSYDQVSKGVGGHYEAVEIRFDPEIISYRTLLAYYFQQIDPTDEGGSFIDRGTHYRSAIFVHSREQKVLATQTIRRINRSGIFGKPVATRVLAASIFYPAEEYHQDYHRKHQLQYRFYRAGSGRDRFIRRVWQNGNAAIFDDPGLDGDTVQYGKDQKAEHGQVEASESQ